MRVSVLVVATMLTTSGLGAEGCAYETGLGPSLWVLGDREAIHVDFGDWQETCRIDVDPSQRPGLGFGGGWFPSDIAICDDWTAQIAFVEPVDGSGDYSIVVFDGKPFYRDPSCDRVAP